MQNDEACIIQPYVSRNTTRLSMLHVAGIDFGGRIAADKRPGQ